jgi:hypothetical protein
MFSVQVSKDGEICQAWGLELGGEGWGRHWAVRSGQVYQPWPSLVVPEPHRSRIQGTGIDVVPIEPECSFLTNPLKRE